jgi:cytochrome P450
MARLLGVADAALDDTGRWVQWFVQGIAPGASAQDVAQAAVAAEALMAQGTTQGLAPVQAANRIAFMQQSLDATAGLLGHVALMLASEPRLATQADRSLDAMRDFVAEVERYCAPIQNTRRFAAEPTILAGQPIAAGQGILLVLASANRDAALNPQPDRFDPDRAQRRSMGFGAGRHACPGAAIAIEIAASAVHWLRGQSRWNDLFGQHTGFRPLANARIPVFT